MNDELAEEEVRHDSSEGASKQIVVDHLLYTRPVLSTQAQDELGGDAFQLDQSMMNVFEWPPGHVGTYEATNAPSVLAENLHLVIDGVTDKEMTYTSNITVPQQQQDHQTTHDVASAIAAPAQAAVVQTHSAEFETLCYRQLSTPLYPTQPQHILSHQHLSWCIE